MPGFLNVARRIFDSRICFPRTSIRSMTVETVRRTRPAFVKLCTRVLLVCAVVYLLVLVVVGVFQRRLVYFPPVFTSQQVDEMARSEKVERWLGPGETRIGWKRLSPKQPAEGQVLITHGNAGCAFHCG